MKPGARVTTFGLTSLQSHGPMLGLGCPYWTLQASMIWQMAIRRSMDIGPFMLVWDWSTVMNLL